jgi:hypothetical protein
VLSDEAVDRLRAAAGEIIRESPEFQRLLTNLSTSPGPALTNPASNAGH